MNITVTKESVVPIYRQIRDAIRSDILKGRLKEGEFLPTPSALAKELNVPKFNVSRAYSELVEEGLVESTNRLTPIISYDRVEHIRAMSKKEFCAEFSKVATDYVMTGVSKSDLMKTITDVVAEVYLKEGERNEHI